jgi:hypothetical protein
MPRSSLVMGIFSLKVRIVPEDLLKSRAGGQ